MKEAGSEPRATVVCALLLTLLALLFTGTAMLPGRVLLPLDLLKDLGAWKSDPTVRVPVSNRLLSDAVLQFYPWDVEIRRLVHQGQMPWVNVWAGQGGPLWANPQTAILSPLIWLRIALGARGWAFAVFLQFVIGGWGMFRLARTAEAGRGAAAVSAAVFMMSGYSIVWGLHPHTLVFAFLPWLTSSAWRALQVPKRRSLLGVALFSALATAGGHPETLVAGVAGITAFLLWEGRSWRGRGWQWLRVPTAAALGFLLLGVILVPFAVLFLDTGVVGLRSAVSARGSLVAAVGSHLLPGILGSPVHGELDLTALFPMAGNFNVRNSGFIGTIVFLLLILTLRRLPRTMQRASWVGLVALVVSWRPPGVSELIKALPVTGFLAQQYFVVVFVLFGSMVSGTVLVGTVRGVRLRGAGWTLIVGGGLLLMVGGVVATPMMRPELTRVAGVLLQELRQRGDLPHDASVYQGRLNDYLERGRETAIRRVVLPGLIWFIAGAALVSGRKGRYRIVVGMSLAELAAFGIGYLPVVRMAEIPGAPPMVERLKRVDPLRQGLLLASGEVYPSNLGTLDRLRQAYSYDVLTVADRTAKLRAGGFEPGSQDLEVDTEAKAEALGDLGVRWIFSRRNVAGARRVGGAPPPGAGVWELKEARTVPLPRNAPPKGLGVGLLVSVGALLLLAGLLFFGWNEPLEYGNG